MAGTRDYDPSEEGAVMGFDGRMSYGDYLRLDAILTAQAPLSDAHDELLFKAKGRFHAQVEWEPLDHAIPFNLEHDVTLPGEIDQITGAKRQNGAGDFCLLFEFRLR